MMAAGNMYKCLFSSGLVKHCLSELRVLDRKCSVIQRINKSTFTGGSKNDSKYFRSSNMGLIAVGLGAGVVFGVGYSWHTFNETKPPILANAIPKQHVILKAKPDIPVSRKVVSSTDSTDLKLLLFQYPTCPFCCKVRAFLDYHGLSYDVVEVDPVLRQQTSWTDYKKVPILLVKVEDGYQQLNDSTMIISALTSYLHDRSTSLSDITRFYPQMQFRDEDGALKTDIMNRYFLMYQGDIPKGVTIEKITEERKWRKWADDVLVHTLSPNVYRTVDEALQAFNWFSEVGEWERLFPAWERLTIVYVGAVAMWGISKRLKKKYQLKDDVRQTLYDDCNTWMRAVHKKGSTFLGGDQPNLADLAVYGVLSSIEGCTAFSELRANTSIAKWYDPMKEAIKQARGSQSLLK